MVTGTVTDAVYRRSLDIKICHFLTKRKCPNPKVVEPGILAAAI